MDPKIVKQPSKYIPRSNRRPKIAKTLTNKTSIKVPSQTILIPKFPHRTVDKLHHIKIQQQFQAARHHWIKRDKGIIRKSHPTSSLLKCSKVAKSEVIYDQVKIASGQIVVSEKIVYCFGTQIYKQWDC